MPFEQSLIFHCSPTLASLKMASLFSFKYLTEEELMETLAYWNEEMREKGISLILMRKKRHNALIYVYRRSRLENILQDREIRRFLSDYGYEGMDLDQSLEYLKERLQEDGFPHEIGFFSELDEPTACFMGGVRDGKLYRDGETVWSVTRQNGGYCIKARFFMQLCSGLYGPAQFG